jgi:hypothetical protein
VDSNRIFRPLLWLLILAGAFFGLASFIAPTTFASLTGFAGTDTFAYRLAGAATFAYAIGLVAGTRASWVELRIPIASTLTFNAASIFACLLAIISGGAQPLVFVILLASVVFTAGTWQLLNHPPDAGKARVATIRSSTARPARRHSAPRWAGSWCCSRGGGRPHGCPRSWPSPSTVCRRSQRSSRSCAVAR